MANSLMGQGRRWRTWRMFIDHWGSRAKNLAGNPVRILVGTTSAKCRDRLSQGRFQCCVTSLLYWGLGDDDHGDQIGAESSPEDWLSSLVTAFQGLHPTLPG